MISCQDADVLAASLSVGSIDAPEQSTLELHLTICADCHRVAGGYLAAAARLPLAIERRRPSPDLRGRVLRAVYAEADQRGREQAPPARRSWWLRLWSGVAAARGVAVLAAAAAAVSAVTSWSVINRQSPSFRLLAMPLAATESAPGAHGQLIYYPDSNEAILTVTGLPAPATIASVDATYEVWLVRRDGAAVAAAYLIREPDGSWSAVVHGEMTAYSIVSATAEPSGGSLTPTGMKVMQATLSNS